MGKGEGGREGGKGFVEDKSREARIEEFLFSDIACLSSIFWKSCLFDQGYAVYCAFYVTSRYAVDACFLLQQ